MAAKFTTAHGNTGTRNVQKRGQSREPSARNHSTLRSSNTMTGMPGYIDAHPSVKIDGAKGGSGSGPKREGDIGRHSESARFKATSHGTVAKDAIFGKHKGHEGGVKSNTSDGTHHLHTKNVSRGSGGSHKGPPTSRGKIPGGIGPSKSGTFGTGVGQGKGRMESLRGAARTHSEGRRKSLMY